MPEGFSILCNRTTAAPCHPELAAKSVETKSKRDFIPLPGVSGSYNLYMKEILNSDKFRKPQRLTFQNDMRKNPPSFHLYKKGAKALLPLFILPAPHLLISLFSSSIRRVHIHIQITADITQKPIAPFQPNLSTINPVPVEERTAPM